MKENYKKQLHTTTGIKHSGLSSMRKSENLVSFGVTGYRSGFVSATFHTRERWAASYKK